MKYDTEIFESDLLSLVKEKFPPKLAEIDAEKSDGIVLRVPLDSEYFNNTSDRVNNDIMSVMYGIVDGITNSIGSSFAQENRYIFLVYLNDLNSPEGETRIRLLRYIRALTEIFNENFRTFQCVSAMKIESISPNQIGWEENEDSPLFKVGGVYIEATIIG